MRRRRLIYCLCLLLLPGLIQAAERQQVRTPDYRLSVQARSPQQIRAFYEARGFPRSAVDLLKEQCYFTVFFHNTSQAIEWLELDNWHFSSEDGPLHRLDRRYWKLRWREAGLAQRFQSTFHWTLFPEQRDFRADERAGGNLILPYTDKAIRLLAHIRQDGPQGEHVKTVRLEHLRCVR